MLDLDDGVPYTDAAKSEARDLVVHALNTMDFTGKEVIVRVNSTETPWWQDDIKAVAKLPARAIVPPKVNSKEEMRMIDRALLEAGAGDLRLWPMIETTAAVVNCEEIATSSGRVETLLFGVGDYTVTAFGEFWDNDLNHLAYPLGRVLTIARAYGLSAMAPAVVFDDLKRVDLIRAQALMLRRMGYDGCEVMYPGHIDTVNEVFTPSEAAIKWAIEIGRAILEAHERGQSAVVVDGKLMEIVNLKLAERTLSIARSLGIIPVLQ
jgi:citrate lyase subunit beta/citryl-CoA lyase